MRDYVKYFNFNLNRQVLEVVAKIKGISEEELANICYENSRRCLLSK